MEVVLFLAQRQVLLRLDYTILSGYSNVANNKMEEG
jgi:hypothetical protein